MISKLLPIIILISFCGGIALGYFYKAKSPSIEAKSKGPAKGPPEVSVIKLKTESVLIEEEFPGRIVANRIAEIRPQIGGIIQKRLFEEGSDVVAGQVLYEIDPASFQAAFERAKADLEKVTTNLNLIQTKSQRYEELIKINGISKQEHDDVVASLAVAKADIKIAEAVLANTKITLNYTKIVAPISGRIGKSIVNEGSLVTTGQSTALAIITQFDKVYVDISQSSADYLRLKDQLVKNEKTIVRLFLDGSDKVYKQEGELQFSEVIVDQSTSAIQLRAIFSNPEYDLLPGSFVKVRLVLGSEEGILIPQRATNRNPDGDLTIWVVNESDEVRQVSIKSSKTIRDNWLVTSGINSGDRIVYKGFQKISQGNKIKVKLEGKE